MRALPAVVLLPVLAGCFTMVSEQPTASMWNLRFVGSSDKREIGRYADVRVSKVTLRSPFDVREMAVLRKDGTIVFDGFNEYAALPSTMLRWMVLDAMEASGRYEHVVSSGSSVDTEFSAEVIFKDMVLDCREAGARKARASVCIKLLKDRAIVGVAAGAGECNAADGDFGKAFSQAVSAALISAISGL